MPTRRGRRKTRVNEYPTGDGKAMAETDWHRMLLCDLTERLELYYLAKTDVYVSGKLLLYYQEGNNRKRVAPDVFVVFGVPNHMRSNYLIWEEGKSPDVVIELTSRKTRFEDTSRKMKLYRDVLRVKEYFLFDPLGHYLTPRLQGYRLRGREYRPVRPNNDRLPSQVLGVHLECDGAWLRFWNPTGRWLATPAEAERQRADALQRELDELKEQLGSM
jgi:Uma2 family endonuclease